MFANSARGVATLSVMATGILAVTACSAGTGSCA